MSGTMLYRAPELEAGLEYDEKVDIFSLGVSVDILRITKIDNSF